VTTAAVTVVIPTIGRPEHLARALSSLQQCHPRADEIIVVDQSDDDRTAAAVAAQPGQGLVRIRSSGKGRGLAVNEGIRAAVNEIVMVVDDDCTVEPGWVDAGQRAIREDRHAIVCGQVLPVAADPRAVPSTLILEGPVDYSGQVRCDVLYAGNMACARSTLLEFGAFDPRIVPAAEDCDLCYRWLRDGRVLKHDPSLVVHHHDWRDPAALRRRYIEYYEGQGRFYAKLLRRRDPGVIRMIVTDARAAVRGYLAGILRHEPAWSDHRRGIARGLPVGLRAGWGEFRGQDRVS
jgi:GT2 family glycosyltransferase